jgi:TRAP-type C4-dicarboxylate transport system permease large subunit
MKKIHLFFFALAIFFLSSCQAIGDIFKAGVWVGVLIVVGVVALIIYLLSRSNKN